MLRPRPERTSGYSIIELMISLVVIAIMAAAVAPSLSELLADNRHASAAMDIVRLARQVRAEARSTGLAQMMRFRSSNDAAGSFGLGLISVHAGMNSKCRQTPWALTFTPTGNSGLGPRLVFDMADFNPRDGTERPTAADTKRHVIALTARLDAETADPVNDLAVCFQSNGDVFTGTGTPPLPVGPGPQTQAVLFQVARWMDDGGGPIARGRPRQVLLPVGGYARLR